MDLPPSPVFATTFLLGLAAFVWRKARGMLLALFVLAVGVTNITRQTAVISPHDLRVITDPTARLTTVRGTLMTSPAEKQKVEEDGSESWRTTATLKVRALKGYRSHWQPAHGRVQVTMPGRLPRAFYQGRQVEVFGILRPPRSAVAPGLFDYAQHLEWRQIYRVLRTEGVQDWSIAVTSSRKATSLPWHKRFQEWAKTALAHGMPERDTPLELLYAMTLGRRSVLHGEVAEPFMQSGTMHVFAISGLHIALLTGLVVILFEMFGIRFDFATLLVLPFMWGYTMATGWQPSAARASIMITVFFLGRALCRPSNLLNSVLAAGLVLLLWHPSELFHVGFQLSFAVVLSLACLLPSLEMITRHFRGHDPLIPADRIPRWRKTLNKAADWLIKSLTTSTAAWLGAAPIIAYYFNLITPISLLANVLIVPLSGFALMSVLASWVTYPLLPGLTVLFNHSAWFWMNGMISFSRRAAELPGAFSYVASPPPGLIGGYYLVVFAAATFPLYKVSLAAHLPRKAPRRLLTLLALAGLTGMAARLASPPSKLKLTILPLEGGHAVLCQAPGRQNDLLIDCGDTSAAKHVTIPLLKHHGYNQLPKLLLTHGDVRHTGGARHLTQSLPIRQHLTSHASFRSSAYREWKQQLQERRAQWKQLEAGDEVAGWQVLYPRRRERFSRADDKAIVCYRKFHGQEILLLSDLGQAGQSTLLSRYPELTADIVVAGLPRQGKALRPRLLDQLQPRLILVCSALFPAPERAPETLIRRLDQRPASVFYLEQSGGLTLRGSANGWILRNSRRILWKGDAP